MRNFGAQAVDKPVNTKFVQRATTQFYLISICIYLKKISNTLSYNPSYKKRLQLQELIFLKTSNHDEI